jgi:hypothetical protein
VGGDGRREGGEGVLRQGGRKKKMEGDFGWRQSHGYMQEGIGRMEL